MSRFSPLLQGPALQPANNHCLIQGLRRESLFSCHQLILLPFCVTAVSGSISSRGRFQPCNTPTRRERCAPAARAQPEPVWQQASFHCWALPSALSVTALVHEGLYYGAFAYMLLLLVHCAVASWLEIDVLMGVSLCVSEQDR